MSSSALPSPPLVSAAHSAAEDAPPFPVQSMVHQHVNSFYCGTPPVLIEQVALPESTRTTIVVEVQLDDSVGLVQEVIQQDIGICLNDACLVFNGRHLASDERLSRSQVGHESTLSLVVRGRGGMFVQSTVGESSSKRRRLSARDSTISAVAAAMGDLSILRRCLHRIHRFSPGVPGKELLDGGNRCASLCLSVLDAAGRAGRLDAIDSLVSLFGVDVNSRDSGGWTCLHNAMLSGDKAVVDRLVALGAADSAAIDGVYASDLWGGSGDGNMVIDDSTPNGDMDDTIMRLVPYESLSPAKLLVQVAWAAREREAEGICATRTNMSSADSLAATFRRVLVSAAAHNRYSLCRICLSLTAEASAQMSERSLNVALLNTCWHHGMECARLLLDNGANIGATTCDGRSCLGVVCGHGDVEFARLLIDRGAEIHCRSRSPLYEASRKGHADCVRLLIDRGADVDNVSDENNAPLRAAVRGRHIDCVRVLLDAGADPNFLLNGSLTPLHDTCMRSDWEFALLLLERGADPRRTTYHGDTPADIARQSQWLGGVDVAKAIERSVHDREAAIERLRTVVSRLKKAGHVFYR